MNNHEYIWKSLKELWWDSIYDQQVYLDNIDNIFVIKEIDETYSVVGYAHITGSMFFIGGLIDFINDIKNFSKEKWPKSTIKIVMNYPISKLKSSSLLLMLPNDVEYYFFNKVSYKNIIPTFQNLQREIEFWKKIERGQSTSYDDGYYCSACQESPCMCSDPEHTSTNW